MPEYGLHQPPTPLGKAAGAITPERHPTDLNLASSVSVAPAVDDRGGAVAAAAGRLAGAARQGLIGLPVIATAVLCGNMAQ